MYVRLSIYAPFEILSKVPNLEDASSQISKSLNVFWRDNPADQPVVEWLPTLGVVPVSGVRCEVAWDKRPRSDPREIDLYIATAISGVIARRPNTVEWREIDIKLV